MSFHSFILHARGPSFGWLSLLTLLVLPARASAGHTDEEQVWERIGGIRIPFIVNAGQTDTAVAYYAPTFTGTVYVTRKGEIVYSLPAPAEDTKRPHAGAGWSLTETAVGGNPRPKREERAVTGVSFFIGNDPALWRSGVATYNSVALGEVWPGVDVRLRAHGRNVEKLFIVQPGAEPSRIRMRVAGAESLRVNEAGALVATTGLGDVTFTPPIAYQERDGIHRSVEVAYRAQGQEYGFSLRGYDRALPVVIDPLLQATYLGGSALDQGFVQAIAASGEVLIAGGTDSINFPGTAGGPQPAFGGGSGDAYVARLNSTLTSLLQATYLGGSGDESAYSLAIAASGEVFIAGRTTSTNFPGTAGGAQPAIGGSVDAYVARMNSTLTALNQATYLGTNAFDEGLALAIGASGEVFVSGQTGSNNFPGTAGGAQPASGGGLDAFVARLNASLTTLSQATYLGGSQGDQAFDIVISASGEVIVAGITTSTDFPGTAGGAQPANGGVEDAFVARLNATLTALNRATYLGGSGSDGGRLAIAASGEVLIVGGTDSINFPGTAGGAQPAFGGGVSDAFVARLNATLTALNQATYLGGSGGDSGGALAVAASGEVFVAGQTSSTNFPGTAGGVQPTIGGSADAFVARLSPSLTALNQATYLGGSGFDGGSALAIAVSGEVLVAGSTTSTNFPGTPGGAQASNGGSTDAFVARLTADLQAGPLQTPTSTPTSLFTSTPTLAPGTPTPTPIPGAPPTDIPTLSPWMLSLLAVALASIALFMERST